MTQTRKVISPRALRVWWALRLQKRRRRGAAVSLPPFPDVTLSNVSIGGHAEWFDPAFDISVDLKSWGVASLEIWLNQNEGGYAFLDVVPSETTSYVHYEATQVESVLKYKARYRNGDDLGSFSNEVIADIQF